jgi:prolyl oligopeptidase
MPKVSKDGRYVAVVSGNTEVRVDHLITKDLQVVRVFEGVPGVFRCVIADDMIYALTDHGAPRNRIVRVPLDSSDDPGTWSELLAECHDTLLDFEIFGDTLVVASLRDCSAAIDVIDLRTGARTAVPLPGRGGVGALVERAAHPALPAFARGADELTFLYSDFATSPAIYRYQVGEGRLECLEAPAMVVDNMTVGYLTAVSADGVEVPMHVIHRTDLDLSRPHPTFLTGYGGFRLADLPAYVNGHAAWLEAGGIYVLAHLRGGGALGADWWRDGRREKKQNSFNDFYAVAERLIELGWTSRQHLAIYGASNGGLLTAVALTQRPELWAAVVSDVPITDLVNMDRSPLTYAIGRDEYGDPKIPQQRRWLEAIDPVRNAGPADYPATLVIAGANDPRCPAAHARLLVDTVEGLQTGEAPILLRVHAEQGHGAQGAIESARRLTEILAFCATHTGLNFQKEV